MYIPNEKVLNISGSEAGTVVVRPVKVIIPATLQDGLGSRLWTAENSVLCI